MKPRVRRATRADKEPLMSFIKDVWGGHDYLPHVWDEWMEDAGAEMFVVEVDGRPVGMNRVRFLEDGSAWLEGVRVHPDHRGMGLATLLGENAMKVAGKRGAAVFRLTSSSRNRAAHRQVARMNFREVGRVSVYEAQEGRRFRAQAGVKRATTKDLKQVMEIIDESPDFQGQRVMWDGFAAVSLTPEVVSRRVKEGAVLLGEGAVAIAMPGREGTNRWNQVSFLSGEPGGAVKLVHHAFSQDGRTWRFATVPQGSPLIRALRKDGLRRTFSLVLYQREAAND